MAELKHLRPRPGLRPTLGIVGLAAMRLELPAGLAQADHGHDVIELAWIESGSLAHRLGPEVLPGCPGSLLVVPVGREHAYAVAPEGAVLWNLLLDPQRLALPPLPRPLARHLAILLPVAGGAALLLPEVDLAAPLRGLLAEQSARAPGWEQAMAAHLRLALIAAARALESGRGRALDAGDARIEALRRRLDERPALAWDLARMGREAGLGRSGLTRAFRRHTGLSPMGYLRQARLRQARALLDDGATLAEAARVVGYGEASALARARRRG